MLGLRFAILGFSDRTQHEKSFLNRNASYSKKARRFRFALFFFMAFSSLCYSGSANAVEPSALCVIQLELEDSLTISPEDVITRCNKLIGSSKELDSKTLSALYVARCEAYIKLRKF